MAEKKRRARGEGSIRQRKDGTWEARFVTGIDPGTGKEIRKSVYAKTQREVRKKMTEAVAALDKDDYKEPSKMTISQWMDIWSKEYLGGVKPYTVLNYTQHIKNHINPAMGAIKLDMLDAHTIQKFYNNLGKERDGKPALSAKTIKNIHGVLHKALSQAVMIGYIRSNPADACTLPRIVQKDIKPLDEDATASFLEAIKGHPYETVFSWSHCSPECVRAKSWASPGTVWTWTAESSLSISRFRRRLEAAASTIWFPRRTARGGLSRPPHMS